MSGPDVAYAVALAKRNSEALSFIPTPQLENYAAKGQLLIQTENDEPCGFLVYGAGFPVMRVYQSCIQFDARRRENGMALVARLVAVAERRQCQGISLWCAQDLEANAFWSAAGFQLIGRREGGLRRGRIHNHWLLPVGPSLWGARS